MIIAYHQYHIIIIQWQNATFDVMLARLRGSEVSSKVEHWLIATD